MQELFDKMLEHLRAQGCKSQYGDKCLYRGPNGTKCAVGALIPDEQYDPTLENESALSLQSLWPDFETRRFLLSCQRLLHDDLDDKLSNLEKHAKDIASRWGLKYDRN